MKSLIYRLDVGDYKIDLNDEISITREEFEGLSQQLIVRMKNVITQTLEKVNIQKSKINFVFQVGGGCRMPMIKEMLLEMLPFSTHKCTDYPDWIVAHGAALYAYQLKGSKEC